MEEFVAVGRVKDAHGLKGELFITLKAGEASWLKKLKTLRLLSPNKEVRSFAIKSARIHKNGIVVLSPEIKDRTAAEGFRGWSFEIPSEFLVSAKGEQIYLREILNFKLNVDTRGEIGVIRGFSTNGAQDLLVVETKQGEFEIPFVEAFVLEIDYTKRVIEMVLPEGLLGEPVDESRDDLAEDE